MKRSAKYLMILLPPTNNPTIMPAPKPPNKPSIKKTIIYLLPLHKPQIKH